MDQVKLVPEVAAAEGESKAKIFDTCVQFLETRNLEEVQEMTRKGIVRWAEVSSGQVIYVPQGRLVVDVTTGPQACHGLKAAVLLTGIGIEGMQALEEMYKANNRPKCAEQCAYNCKAARTLSKPAPAARPAAPPAGDPPGASQPPSLQQSGNADTPAQEPEPKIVAAGDDDDDDKERAAEAQAGPAAQDLD